MLPVLRSCTTSRFYPTLRSASRCAPLLRSSSFHRPVRALCVPRSDKEDTTPTVSNWNTANYLTVFRLALAPAIGALILQDHNTLALGALCICGLTDALDGHIARTQNCRTALGATLDPLADKALVASSAFALCIQGALPLPAVAIIITRDIALISAACILPRDRWISPTPLSKLNTGLQITLCVAAVASTGDLTLVPPSVVNGLAIATATTTTLSGAQYATRFARIRREHRV